jgi:hypothetical protein
MLRGEIMTKARWQSTLAHLTCLAVAAGCATGARPVAAPVALAPRPALPARAADTVPTEAVFADARTAAPALVASLVAVSPARIVADLDGLSARLGLPMQAGHELVAWLGSSGKVGDGQRFQRFWDRLDPSAPLAVAWLLAPRAGVRGYCAALSFKDATSARQSLDDLGNHGGPAGGVFAIEVTAGQTIWATVKGPTLLVASSAEVLLLGGALTESLRTNPKLGQTVLTIMPQALARASGLSRDQIVAGVLYASGRAASRGTVTPGAQRVQNAVAETVIKLALEAAEVRVILALGAQDGPSVHLEMLPSPGTDLAAMVGHQSSYHFDERLPVRSDRTAVLAMGDLTPWLAPFTSAFALSGPAGQAMRAKVNQWFARVSDVSCVVEPVAAGFTSLCSSALAPGTPSRQAVEDAVALVAAENAWEAELEGRKATPLKVRRKQDVEIDKKIESKDPSARWLAQAMAGGEVVTTVVAVKNGRLVQATGPKARELVSAYGPVAGLEHAPGVSAALTATRDQEGVAVVDVVAAVLRLARKASGMAANPMMALASSLPGLAEMQAPFVLAWRGGDAAVLDFAIPGSSLDHIAKVVHGLFGFSR